MGGRDWRQCVYNRYELWCELRASVLRGGTAACCDAAESDAAEGRLLANVFARGWAAGTSGGEGSGGGGGREGSCTGAGRQRL